MLCTCSEADGVNAENERRAELASLGINIEASSPFGVLPSRTEEIRQVCSLQVWAPSDLEAVSSELELWKSQES